VNRFLLALPTAGLLVLATIQAHAEPASEQLPRPCVGDARFEPSATRRGVAVAAAIVPGSLVHGAGHWVAGQPCTARRIASAEAIGFAGIVAGGSTIIFTGASRYLMAPAITLTIGGFGLFITSFVADVYGVSGAARYAGEPLRWRPRWETEFGLLRVDNPLFDFEWLISQKAATHLGSASVSAALDTALDGAHARYQLGIALRSIGPRPDALARDGSFFDLYTGLAEQRYVTYGFVTDSAEMLGTGRLDLGRVGPSLRGSFVEMSLGLALVRTRYVLEGLSVPADFESLLLGRIAFGVYLGRGVHRGGEVTAYYDHRHDDYAAGMKVPGLGGGAVGHAGLSARYFFSNRLGAGVVAEAGSALVTGISLLFRAGGQP
jgi:hypothetical protein